MAIEQLLSDEKAMVGMCLTWKAQDLARLTSHVLSAEMEGSNLQSLRSLRSILNPRSRLALSTASLNRISLAMGGSGGSFLSDYISPMEAQIANVELLLEAYFHSFDSMFHKLQVGDN